MFRDHITTSDKLTTAPGLFVITLSSIALGGLWRLSAPDFAVAGNTRYFVPENWYRQWHGSAWHCVHAYFAPHLVARYGNIPVINIGLCVAALMMVALRFKESLHSGLASVSSGGLGLGLHWVLTEAWLARIASDQGRTRVMALYATAIGLGFVAGPGIIWLFGFETATFFRHCHLAVGWRSADLRTAKA